MTNFVSLITMKITAFCARKHYTEIQNRDQNKYNPNDIINFSIQTFYTFEEGSICSLKKYSHIIIPIRVFISFLPQPHSNCAQISAPFKKFSFHIQKNMNGYILLMDEKSEQKYSR